MRQFLKDGTTMSPKREKWIALTFGVALLLFMLWRLG